MSDSSGLGNVSGYSNNESKIMGSKEFLESNSLVAKVAFLLVVFLIFSHFLRVGIKALFIMGLIITSPIYLRAWLMPRLCKLSHKTPMIVIL